MHLKILLKRKHLLFLFGCVKKLATNSSSRSLAVYHTSYNSRPVSQAAQGGGSPECENTHEMVLDPSSEVLSQLTAQAKSYRDAVQNHYSSAKIKLPWPRVFETAWLPRTLGRDASWLNLLYVT